MFTPSLRHASRTHARTRTHIHTHAHTHTHAHARTYTHTCDIKEKISPQRTDSKVGLEPVTQSDTAHLCKLV
jgi:hypothetical protein